MKSKKIKKSENDISKNDRRGFLKSIGKAIVPSMAILGLGMSGISCGCRCTCPGGCEYSCEGGCEGACTGTCGYTCYTGY